MVSQLTISTVQSLEIANDSTILRIEGAASGASELPARAGVQGAALLEDPIGTLVFRILEQIDISGTLATEESFTIALDLTTGTDPATILPLTTQARSDDQGTFKTFAAVLSSLRGVRVLTGHTVTIELAAGTHVLTAADTVLDFSQIVDGGGNIEITPVGVDKYVRRGGTPLLAVVSGTAHGVTFGATGLGVNTQRGHLLRGVSGSNTGFIRPVRSHTDTVFVIPSSWEGSTPVGAETFEVVEGVTILTGFAGKAMRGNNIPRAGAATRFIRWTGVEWQGDLSDDFDVEGLQLQLNDLRISGLPLLISSSTMFWEGGVSYDGAGAGAFGWPGITMQSDSIFQPLDNNAGHLIRDFAFLGLAMVDGSQASIFRIAVDDIVSFAFISAAFGIGNFSDVNFTFSNGNLAASGVEHYINMGGPLAAGGGRVETILFTLANAPTGSVNDLLVDSGAFDWAFVDATMAAPSSWIGFELSRFIKGAS